MANVIIPPHLGVLAAQAVNVWRQAMERSEHAARAYHQAQGDLAGAEKNLRELARALAIVIHTAQTAPPPAQAAPTSEAPHPAEMPAADVIEAWMRAGSPTDSDGNMLIDPSWPGGQR